MRIGIHMGYSSADQVAAECRDCGVDEIFLSANSVPGFDERGHATEGEFTRVIEELRERGVLVSGVILSPPSQEAVLGTDLEERRALCETIRAAGRAGIDTSLFYPLDRFLHFHEYHEGRPLMVMPGDEDWGKVVAFLREVVAAADEVGLRLGNHLWAVDVVHSIWEAAPSPNNGVTYCQGMWLIGEEPHTPAETWGMDRIFFAHARNQVRTGPALMDHDEVPLGSGDVDMARCVRALQENQYEGVIIPEHLGPQSTADAVRYLKGLIA